MSRTWLSARNLDAGTLPLLKAIEQTYQNTFSFSRKCFGNRPYVSNIGSRPCLSKVLWRPFNIAPLVGIAVMFHVFNVNWLAFCFLPWKSGIHSSDFHFPFSHCFLFPFFENVIDLIFRNNYFRILRGVIIHLAALHGISKEAERRMFYERRNTSIGL